MRWDFENEVWMMSPAKAASIIKPGEARNPLSGNEHENAIIRMNARKATVLRQRLLDALESKIESAIVRAEVREDEVVGESGICQEAAERVLALLKGDTLRLLTDAEDRGYGKPTQKTLNGHVFAKDVDPDMSPETAAELYQRELQSGK